MVDVVVVVVAASAAVTILVVFCVFICSMAFHWPNRFIIIILSLLFFASHFVLCAPFGFCDRASCIPCRSITCHWLCVAGGCVLCVWSEHKLLMPSMKCSGTKHFICYRRSSRSSRSNRTECVISLWPFRIYALSPSTIWHVDENYFICQESSHLECGPLFVLRTGKKIVSSRLVGRAVGWPL